MLMYAKQKPWKIALPILVATLCFIISLASIILTTIRNNELGSSLCAAAYGPVKSGTVFTCTRELAACSLVATGLLSPIGDNSCREIKAGRWLLVPVLMLSVVLLGLWGVQLVVAKRKNERASADERYESLMKEEGKVRASVSEGQEKA
ncbi:hypothetical protein EJ02DRAFT_460115 [Clathrospora elynae]|uniref:Uncharacterized protein n=1 Tax=Clathrospora elynae TaxID=706981 RepID=A0A6A5SBC5_9PLEO|nr:hypothetical protein EJ02DRAFT_460115 [Clathrospora elynae]